MDAHGHGRRGGFRGRIKGGGGGGGGRSVGRWSPRSPPFFHPQSVAGDRDDVCGTDCNSKGGRKTCSEHDDDDDKSSKSGSGSSNKNFHQLQSQCTSPAALEDINKKEEEDAYSGTGSGMHSMVPPSQSRERDDDEDSFDICHITQQVAAVVLKPPLLVTNRERRNQINKSTQSQSPLLIRPGMLLLKSHISLPDQVKIVRRCRELGVGSGGFYQPGYQEGTKLHLRMMCLGKHWDPQSGHYTDHRPCDGAKPPLIPPEFHQLVYQALNHYRTPQEILPPMSPDICIVNFYSQNGRLGLHQDKDESPQSLRQGLPVVSFSIGDSADFLYGDHRDVDRAQKLLLESGDVLIFGGCSRNLFHGVSAIHPRTAPSLLLHQADLRPGRLNLTFRQY